MVAPAPTGLLHADGRNVSRAEVDRARFGSAFEGASQKGTFLSGWRAALRSADNDWLPDRDRSVARARDIARNDVIGASAIARRVNSAVGFNWSLSSRPNARALGITPEEARELGQQIQTEWKMYADSVSFLADAERTLTFGQQLRLSAAHIFADGEALGLIEWAADEEPGYRTRLRIVDPDRLSNPHNKGDSPTLRGGVEKNEHSVPFRYWIREQHPADLGAIGSMVWTPFDRWTPWGRPQVLHAFDKLRAGQSRGITRFVSALKAFRSLSKYTDATIEAATINALFVAFIKSNSGPAAASENFTADDVVQFEEERQKHYGENPVELNGAIMPTLPFGDEVELQTAGRDTSGFEAFTRAIIRLIAASLGVTYEELSMDFSQTNYSSARAALAVAWSETLTLRGLIAAQIANPFFSAWLEEAFDLGRVKAPKGAPDFYSARDAYSQAVWRGPGRGVIDPTKEVDAAAARIELGLTTLEDECAAYDGSDWEEKLAQSAEEMRRREELGLAPVGGGGREAAHDAARDPVRDKDLDQKPGNGAIGFIRRAASSALSRVRLTARSAEHARSLDERPTA